MPTYFFDININGQKVPDTEGSAHDGRDEARAEALATLCEFATDLMPHENERLVTIEVREGNGVSFLSGELKVSLSEQPAAATRTSARPFPAAVRSAPATP